MTNLVLLLLAPVAVAQTLTIRAGNLIDPATGAVRRNQVIVVKDGKIESIGAGAAGEVIDLSSEWVMPGLMDAHTHVSMDLGTGISLQEPQLVEGSPIRALRGLRNAQDMLRAGFTTLRDVGNGANYAVIDLKRAIDQGWFVGPTILTAGKIIAPFGGQAVTLPPEQGPLWSFEYDDADGPEEIRKAVRRNIFYGADVIKLVADNSDYYYSEEEIRAAVNEAHLAGRAVAVHVFHDAPARNVILGGADSVEHGFWLSDDVLKLMKEHGTALVGTDMPHEVLVELQARHQLPDPNEMERLITDRLRRAYALGVTLVFGTDVVVSLPGKTRGDIMLDYLLVWKAAGVPNTEVLKAMTTNAAALLRVQKQRGAIVPGLAADIVGMPANPLADTGALHGIDFVTKDGRVVRRP